MSTAQHPTSVSAHAQHDAAAVSLGTFIPATPTPTVATPPSAVTVNGAAASASAAAGTAPPSYALYSNTTVTDADQFTFVQVQLKLDAVVKALEYTRKRSLDPPCVPVRADAGTKFVLGDSSSLAGVALKAKTLKNAQADLEKQLHGAVLGLAQIKETFGRMCDSAWVHSNYVRLHHGREALREAAVKRKHDRAAADMEDSAVERPASRARLEALNTAIQDDRAPRKTNHLAATLHRFQLAAASKKSRGRGAVALKAKDTNAGSSGLPLPTMEQHSAGAPAATESPADMADVAADACIEFMVAQRGGAFSDDVDDPAQEAQDAMEDAEEERQAALDRPTQSDEEFIDNEPQEE